MEDAQADSNEVHEPMVIFPVDIPAAPSLGSASSLVATPEIPEEIRISIADLITTNIKLRRAVKEREAERSNSKSEIERMKKELAEAEKLVKHQADDILSASLSPQNCNL